MGSAHKRKPIGFVKPEEMADDKTRDARHQTQDQRLKTFKNEPEGPMLGLLKITVRPDIYKSLENSKFLKLRLKSEDGKFAIDLILKDAETFLELVPRRMPAISMVMSIEAFSRDVEQITIVHLEDGQGNRRGFRIAMIRQAELMNDSHGLRKLFFSS